jgi:hypothetical protein
MNVSYRKKDLFIMSEKNEETKTKEETADEAHAPSFEAEAAANQQEETKTETETTEEKKVDDKETKTEEAVEGVKKEEVEVEEDAKPEANASTSKSKAAAKTEEAEEDLGDPILEPDEMDVLSGRGASVNSHGVGYL